MRRWKQQLGGLLIALVGGGGTAWMWNTAVREGYFYPKASMLLPAFCVLGLGLMLFPGYKEERTARGEDITGLTGMRLITPRWWVILTLALAAGVTNYAIMSSQ